jgi:hypothetical protein
MFFFFHIIYLLLQGVLYIIVTFCMVKRSESRIVSSSPESGCFFVVGRVFTSVPYLLEYMQYD